MQKQTESGLRCPNCGGEMKGLTVSLHHYECNSCRTNINGVTINSNALQGLLATLCIVGIIALFAGALE